MNNIRKACLFITRSNGGINRYRSEETVLREFDRFYETLPYRDLLQAIDAWLGTLMAEQFETVCDGEMSEADVILKNAPPFTETLLNDWFETA